MKIFFSAFLVLSGTVVVAQDKEHKSYTQDIKGTSLSFSMQAIPGGVFSMGSNNVAHPEEQPVHQVKIDPFWMGTYEVTWDIYEPFLYKDYEQSKQTEGSIPAEVDAVTRPSKPYLDMTFGMGKQGQPALAMTNYNAIQFCKWLYTRTGVFYRLPTEAEWEYACRAGSKTAYFFGDDSSALKDYAWFADNSAAQTHKVGEKKPNAYGLYDMLGNVGEWTYDQYHADTYAKRSSSLSDNPVVEPTELYAHVVRGGGFDSKADALRSASRGASDPFWKQLDPQMPKSNWWFPEAPFVGMRLVRPVTPPSHEEIMAYYNQEPIADL